MTDGDKGESLRNQLAEGIPAYREGLEMLVRRLEAQHTRDEEYFHELNMRFGAHERLAESLDAWMMDPADARRYADVIVKLDAALGRLDTFEPKPGGLSSRLRELRQARNLTLRAQSELIFRKTGHRISFSYLSELERNDQADPGLRILRDIAAGYELSLAQLLEG